MKADEPIVLTRESILDDLEIKLRTRESTLNHRESLLNTKEFDILSREKILEIATQKLELDALQLKRAISIQLQKSLIKNNSNEMPVTPNKASKHSEDNTSNMVIDTPPIQKTKWLRARNQDSFVNQGLATNCSSPLNRLKMGGNRDVFMQPPLRYNFMNYRNGAASGASSSASTPQRIDKFQRCLKDGSPMSQ